MNLVIVESPSKAKTIEKYLKDISPKGDFVVRASVGHVRDLPKSNKKAIDIPGGFIPHYEITKGKEKIIHELAMLAEKADEIFLATDPDREGEAISWHIKELLEKELGKKNVKIVRATFHEITKEAVKEALDHPRKIDANLVKAQEARRVLDRLVGYDLSGLIWKKVRYGLSAGRVQSPALRLICEKEREIRAFIPQEYWIIAADFNTKNKDKLTLICVEEPKNKKDADKIIETAKTADWTVKDVVESEAKRTPRPPFTTSTLQQAASSRLGYSPKRTMITAQKLYEAGHITYMRTDSTSISTQAVGVISSYINDKFGKNYLQTRAYQTKVKNAQEAHEAIRPTHVDKSTAGFTPEQKNLYKLIWQRTVASQMADARIMRTKITGQSGPPAGGTPDFTATGSRVIFDGWLKADPEARGEDVELPKVASGEPLKLLDISGEQKFTQPPARYSEAGLVKALEERGIGRPSTYASIISTLESRAYVEKEGRALKPTDTGEVVSQFIEENFANYISDTFTAEMENELDEIASGERDYTKTLKDFYGPFNKDVKSKEKIDKLTNLGEADAKYKCPKCGSGMVIKLSRGGKFLSCSRYPDCQGALTIDGIEIKADEPIGTDPETGEQIYVKTGRFGPYVQLGDRVKGKKTKPKMASIPKNVDPTSVTLEMALKYLSIPRTLGNDPKTGASVTANNGRFGPYVAHNGEFRSIKPPDDVYTIELPRALELLAQEKKSHFRKTKTKKT